MPCQTNVAAFMGFLIGKGRDVMSGALSSNATQAPIVVLLEGPKNEIRCSVRMVS
jgi:hypothetical protein